jgi:hypothetical protein
MKITKALQATAYHEAGHAVAAWYLGAGVESASIVPDDDTTGRVYYERHPLEGIDINLPWLARRPNDGSTRGPGATTTARWTTAWPLTWR